MKQKIALSIILGTFLIFTGCAKKPEINKETNNKNEISLNNNLKNNENSNKLNLDEINGNENISSKIETIDPLHTVLDENNRTIIIGSDPGFSSIYFKYDSFEIDEEMYSLIKKNIKNIKKIIKLEGNCDEFGSDEYNSALGLKRANTVKSVLLDNGIKEEQISITSFGESNPICLESNENCWSKNRRVDFKNQ